MDLRNYAKEIFMIGRQPENKPADLHVAQAMFEANLRQEKETYKGSGTFDYAKVGAEWNALPTGERQKLSNAVSDAMNYWYFQLVELVASSKPADQQEWDVFEKLVFAPKQGKKMEDDGIWSVKEQNKYKSDMVKKIRNELHPTEDAAEA